MKRILCGTLTVLLALTIVFSFGTTAMAAGDIEATVSVSPEAVTSVPSTTYLTITLTNRGAPINYVQVWSRNSNYGMDLTAETIQTGETRQFTVPYYVTQQNWGLEEQLFLRGRYVPDSNGQAIPETDIGSICVRDANPPTINHAKYTLSKGANVQLQMTHVTGTSVWQSSNPAVATVDAAGKVVAKRKGKATISAQVGGGTYQCALTVEDPKLSKKSLALYIGNKADISLKGTAEKKVRWVASNKYVVSVSGTPGKATVKAVGPGKSFVAITIGGKTFKCNVTVKADPSNKPTISLKEFKAIKKGMHLKQVRAIIGSAGTLKSQYSYGGTTYKYYGWKGEGSIGANAIICFRNNIMNSKAQAGLG